MVHGSPFKASAAGGCRRVVFYLLLTFALPAIFSNSAFTLPDSAGLAQKSSNPNQKNERAVLQPTDITLISPTAGSVVMEPRPTFRWKFSGLRAGVPKVFYTLRIVELQPKQTLDEALMKNPPVLERRNLTEDSFQFPERGAQLVAARVYAWRVRASDLNGKEISQSLASLFGRTSLPQWALCALSMLSTSFDYCIGPMSGLTVGVMTGGSLNYTWTLVQTSGQGTSGGSGPSTSTITIPTGALPTTPGTYTYTLTVTDGTCTQTANFTIVVDVPPVAGTITVTPDPPATQLPLCAGEAAVLTLNGQSMPGLIQWYSSTNPNSSAILVLANMISVSNTTQNTNPLNTTTYFAVQVSSLNGACPPAYTIVQVPVKPPHGPVPISGPSVRCVGASATLNVASGGAGCTSFQWYCDGAPCGPNSPSMTVVPFPFLTDTDPVNYQVECFDGCSTVSSNVWTIQPDLLAVKINGPCCPCKGQKIQLCAQPVNGTPPYQYQWSSSAGSGITQCKLVLPVMTTTYSVTVTDANGCQAMDSFTATVCP